MVCVATATEVPNFCKVVCIDKGGPSLLPTVLFADTATQPSAPSPQPPAPSPMPPTRRTAPTRKRPSPGKQAPSPPPPPPSLPPPQTGAQQNVTTKQDNQQNTPSGWSFFVGWVNVNKGLTALACITLGVVLAAAINWRCGLGCWFSRDAVTLNPAGSVVELNMSSYSAGIGAHGTANAIARVSAAPANEA
jgi:hypothetical protein